MNPINKLKKAVKKINDAISVKKEVAQLEKMVRDGLPVAFLPGLEYLTTGKRDEIARLAAHKAESRRAAIASEGDKKVPIWYSPKPGSAGEVIAENLKPSPGKVIEFTMERIARTGKSEKWGTFLHLLVREFECERGVELGSCAGISALYLSSVPSVKELITVEGSKELSKIAEMSLEDCPQARVVNSLFDEAIEREIASATDRFDFAYIDGHHEKVATIHYFNRLVPFLSKGSLVIFDDVSWSYDMREAWDVLSERKEFSHAIDLGAIGVCVMKSNDDQNVLPMKWDLQQIIGVHPIGDPEGWKE